MDYNSSSPGTISVNSNVPPPFKYDPPPRGDMSQKPITLWPGLFHSPVTSALWDARTKMFDRLLDTPNDAPPQTELLLKTPARSRTKILYNFSSDYLLREQYRGPWNEVRIGKLLEDLDALASTISVKHCYDDNNVTRPLLLVTAAVDKIVLKKPVSVDVDLKMVGSVIWVGRSSIEIQLEVTQSTKNSPDASASVALTANFIFVARDSKTGKAAPVNRLSPETEKEKLLFEDAETRSKLRKTKIGGSRKGLENGEVDRLLAGGRIFCDMPALADKNSILLRDTTLESCLICQPQQRNTKGRIFGGFLMHRAFELAFSTAYAFAGLVPYFIEVDHVDFLRPVDVGDFLRFKSCVLYTQHQDLDQPLINVEVIAHVMQPELRSCEVSNTFYFTFTVHPEAKATQNGFRILNVLPATEEEARRIVERMDAETLKSNGTST